MQVQELNRYFEISAAPVAAQSIPSGRINDSYHVRLDDGSAVIVQRLNHAVLPNSAAAMENFESIRRYLAETGIRFPLPCYIPARAGGLLHTADDGTSWRVYRFISGVTSPPGEAVSAAALGASLGAFHVAFSDFPVETLHASLPNYHNTPHRFEIFAAALSTAPQNLTQPAAREINFVLAQRSTCPALLELNLPARVTHNDIKLENLLVDQPSGRPVCLIDFDTLMPGVLAFDFGDGARSACRTGSTDAQDISRVGFRLDLFETYTREYLAVAGRLLQDDEATSLALGAIVISLELGIRYLTDYLNGNRYFKVGYPLQNLERARVQLLICHQMQQCYADMVGVVRRYLP